MNSFFKIFVAILVIALLAISTQFLFFYVNELRAEERKSYLNNTAWGIVNSMSLEDKIGQVIHISIPGKTLDNVALAEMRDIRPGGIIHFGKNFGTKNEIIQLNRDLQNTASKLGLAPLLISTDQEGGRVFRVRDGVAQFPGAMAMGQTGSEELGEMVGFITSYELNLLGVNFLLAPSLDVNNNPSNPVINTRSFGSDPNRVSRVAGAYERGARIGGAIPVIKHFPGHGDTNVDSHLGLPIINKTLNELEELELIPFRESIQSGAPVVMTAHILYPKLDPDFPTTLSPIILTDILRNKLKFQGVIITDAMEMHAISKNYEKIKPGVKAILSGADILLLTSFGDTTRALKNELMEANLNNTFLVAGKNILDEAVYRQIRLKLEYGIYTQLGIPIIKNENLANFMRERRDDRDAKYKSYYSDPNLVFNTTLQTIRSYPNELIHLNENSKKDFVAFLRNKKFINAWIEEGGKNLPHSTISKNIQKNLTSTIIADFSNEKELQSLLKIIRSYPNTKFILLYPGTPFIQLPNDKNLTILFSFSVTDESYSALAKALWRLNSIPKLDLILKD